MSTATGKHGKHDTRARGRIEDWPISLTVEEAATILGIGRTAAYEAVKQGIIPHFRVGRHVRVGRDRLFAWIDSGDQERGDGAIEATGERYDPPGYDSQLAARFPASYAEAVSLPPIVSASTRARGER